MPSRAATARSREPAYARAAVRGATGSRWIVVTAGIAVEFCLALWSADMLRRPHRPLAGAARPASVTALVAGMAIGRIVGGRLALRLAGGPAALRRAGA